MLKPFLSHQYGRLLLLCFFSFCFLEIWLYLSAYQDPSQTGILHRGEGVVSLVLLVGGYFAGLRYFADESKYSVAGWLLILGGLVVLFFVPFTPLPQTSCKIEVFKSERLLRVTSPGERDRSYRIALGSRPVGDKEVQGDCKTPEGSFLIVDKAPSHFRKWLALSYPTPSDAWRGRLEGKITWAELWYIKVETLNGRIPYSTSALGGSVGLHGDGSEKDWTLGCVALDNDDIDEIFEIIPLGTEVTIHP